MALSILDMGGFVCLKLRHTKYIILLLLMFKNVSLAHYAFKEVSFASVLDIIKEILKLNSIF